MIPRAARRVASCHDRGAPAPRKVAPDQFSARRRRTHWAHATWFPAAAAYAALAVPLSLQGMLGGMPWVAGFATPAGHARELLFGYALAVIVGYLSGRERPLVLGGLFATWLSARACWWFLPGSLLATLWHAVFVVVLVWRLAPRFWGRGRKWRNLALVPLLIALGASALGFELLPADRAPIERSAVLLLAWLMAFMGGRLLAPAIAGQLERQGLELEARVQPRLEGGIILLLACAVLAALAPRATALTGVCTVAAAILILLRLARWPWWRIGGRFDLVCLGIGYAWIAVGLLLFGGALLRVGHVPGGALHALTVGALGTLTFNVMLRTALHRRHADPAHERLLWIGTTLIGVATLARLGADCSSAWAARTAWLTVAAATWSGTFALLAVTLVRGRRGNIDRGSRAARGAA